MCKTALSYSDLVNNEYLIYILSVIGLIGLSSINTDPRQQMRGYSDQEVWRLCIRDIQDSIIHTMSDIIKVTYYLDNKFKIYLFQLLHRLTRCPPTPLQCC